MQEWNAAVQAAIDGVLPLPYRIQCSQGYLVWNSGEVGQATVTIIPNGKIPEAVPCYKVDDALVACGMSVVSDWRPVVS